MYKKYVFESHFYINNITIQYNLLDIILALIHLAVRQFIMQKFGSECCFEYIIYIFLFIT